VKKWKIIFTKLDGSKKIFDGDRELFLELAESLNEQYGEQCFTKVLFRYPFSKYPPIGLDDYIKQQRLIETENGKTIFSE